MIPTDSQINVFLSTMEFPPGTIIEKVEIPVKGSSRDKFLMLVSWNPVDDRQGIFLYEIERPQPIKAAAVEI